MICVQRSFLCEDETHCPECGSKFVALDVSYVVAGRASIVGVFYTVYCSKECESRAKSKASEKSAEQRERDKWG